MASSLFSDQCEWPTKRGGQCKNPSHWDVWTHDKRVLTDFGRSADPHRSGPAWISVCGFHWADVQSQVTTKRHVRY